uniref:Alternative protein LRFN1 n=1 Tax=Homo sapiens TaxID=9606 RepID=L8E910_HUMAN|nr:alternative protein LRFN1 [Homo sapiens]
METWGWAPPGRAWLSPAPSGCWRVPCERRAGAGTPGCRRPNAQPHGRWGGTGRKRSAKTLDQSGDAPLSPGGGGAASGCGSRPRPRAQGGVRGPAAGLPSPMDSSTPLLPLPSRARGPRWSRCLTQRSAGRGRAP